MKADRMRWLQSSLDVDAGVTQDRELMPGKRSHDCPVLGRPVQEATCMSDWLDAHAFEAPGHTCWGCRVGWEKRLAMADGEGMEWEDVERLVKRGYRAMQRKRPVSA